MIKLSKKIPQGTILIITLFFIVLMTLEVTMISFVMQRSVGEKAISGTAYQAAKGGTQVAVQRLKDNLYEYLVQNGSDNVTTAFAKGGSNDIDDEDLLAYNAEGSADEDTGVDISAWVEEKRGVWYHIMARAKYGDTDLLSHEWVKINDGCMAGSTNLTTIVPSAYAPGVQSVAVDSNGRVFFGEVQGSNDSLWTWHKTTGLTTLVDNEAFPGTSNDADYSWINGIVVAGNDRVFFGEANNVAEVWTWRSDTGLSTIGNLDVFSQIGHQHNLVTNASGQAAFSSNLDYCTNGAPTYFWSEAGGLSTIIPEGLNINSAGGSIALTDTGRVYMGEYCNPGMMLTWTAAGGLASLTPTQLNQPGRYSIAVYGERVFFAENGADGDVYTWLPGGGLTTICDACGTHPGREAWFLDSTGRYSFGDRDGSGNFYTYHSSTGLTTVISGLNQPGYQSTAGTPSGRVYFGEIADFSDFFTYHVSTGLSTVISGNKLGVKAIAVLDNGRVFFGSQRYNAPKGPFLTYHPNTGVTTIFTSGGPGRYGYTFALAVDNSDERVYFGGDSDTPGFWTWNPSAGLSTILGNTFEGIGTYGSIASDDNGTVYFGQGDVAAPFWEWSSGVQGCAY